MGWKLKVFEPSETDLEIQICYFLERKLALSKRPYMIFATKPRGNFNSKTGVMQKHRNPYVRPGHPDVVLILDGAFYGFEVKTSKGVQSDNQKAFERDLKKANAHYYIVRSLQEVNEILKEILPS